MFRLEDLKTFTCLAEQGSLKEAASQLHKTQPALSQAIKRLEQSLGFELFDRSQYRLELTVKGNALFQRAIPLISHNNEVWHYSQLLSQGQEVSATVTVQAPLSITKILPIIKMVQLEFPDTEICLERLEINETIYRLQTDQLDLAVTAWQPMRAETKSLEVTKLGKVNLVAVCSAKLFEQYHDQIENAKENILHQIIFKDERKVGAHIGISNAAKKTVVNRSDTQLSLLLNNMGWARVPRESVESYIQEGSLVVMPDNDGLNICTDLVVARRINSSYGPVCQLLWDQICQLKM